MNAIKCQECNAALNLELTRNGLCKCEFCNTTHNLSQEITLKCNLNDKMFSRVLYDALSKNLDLEELKDLTYIASRDERIVSWRLDWEDIKGNSKSSKCRELICWFERRSGLSYLVEYAIKQRPMIIFELS